MKNPMKKSPHQLSLLVSAIASLGVVSTTYAALNPQGLSPSKLHAAAEQHARMNAPVTQLIVKMNATPSASPSALAASIKPLSAVRLQAMSERAGVKFSAVRQLATGAEVLRLEKPLAGKALDAVVQQLSQISGVRYVEADRRLYALSTTNDARLHEQWALQGNNSGNYGANVQNAWDSQTGQAKTVVAVVDTGITKHEDLDSSRVLAGYDFISQKSIANDGDGRDADASDAGDWVTQSDIDSPDFKDGGCEVNSSSWHGTFVSGIIGASSNNTLGIAGVNWAARLLPIRVLGKCGGDDSDISDGILWAAGAPIQGTPTNPNPADIINLSLGGEGACSRTQQESVDWVNGHGKLIIVAAGNESQDANKSSPANCHGVLAVAASGINGNLASYSNFGHKIALTAPGGANGGLFLGLTNAGKTTSVGNGTYAKSGGTSFAAPMVAGVASLVLAQNPALTHTQVGLVLQASTRSFPVGSDCNQQRCGTGLLDATKAVALATGILPNKAQMTWPLGVTTQSVSYTNLASTPIQLGGVLQTGVDAGHFQVIKDECSNTTLAAGASCAIDITITINGYAADASLSLASNQATVGRVTLLGNQGGVALFKHTPDTLDFGTVKAGSQSAIQTITVSNIGTTSSAAMAIALGNTCSLIDANCQKSEAYYTLVSDQCTGKKLTPQSSCTVSVQFTPPKNAPLGDYPSIVLGSGNDTDDDVGLTTLRATVSATDTNTGGNNNTTGGGGGGGCTTGTSTDCGMGLLLFGALARLLTRKNRKTSKA